MGEPSRPVMKMRYRSWFVTPHMNREPVSKLYGRIGLSLLSVSVLAEGPSPWPAVPWHFQHSIFWNSSRPWRMLWTVSAGSDGTVIGVPARAVFHFVENVLMYATRSTRFWAVRGRHCGMFVVTNPRVIALNRSSSVGKVPVGVERHLNTASVKSRGLGSIHGAFSPLPSPSGPWQPTQ